MLCGFAIQRGWGLAYTVFGIREYTYPQDILDLILDGVGHEWCVGGFVQDLGAHFRGLGRVWAYVRNGFW